MPADLHLPAGGRGPGIVLFQEIFGVKDTTNDLMDQYEVRHI
jgi:dienelactone hydrolase